MGIQILTLNEKFNLSVVAFKTESKDYELLFKQFNLKFYDEKTKDKGMIRYVIQDLSLKRLNQTFLNKLNQLQNKV